MGTITINVEDEVEEYFRKKVREKYGQRKGALGKAFTEAIDSWAKRQKYFETCEKLLEEGVDLGGLTYKRREELHERH